MALRKQMKLYRLRVQTNQTPMVKTKIRKVVSRQRLRRRKKMVIVPRMVK